MTAPEWKTTSDSVLDRFRDLAEQVLLEARLKTQARDALDAEMAEARTQDAEDERREIALAQELEQVRERRAGRARRQGERLAARMQADAEAQERDAAGRQALAWLDQLVRDHAARREPVAGRQSYPPVTAPMPSAAPAGAETPEETTAVCRCGEPGRTEDEMYQCEADDCVAHDYLACGGSLMIGLAPNFPLPSTMPGGGASDA